MNILNSRVKFYQDVKRDLRHLQNSFEEYFPHNSSDKNHQRSPFTGSYQMQDFSLNEYGQLIDILSDSVFK